MATYVAPETMLRLGSGALWGSGCLLAERAIWGGRRCRSRRRERNISRAGLPSRLSRCGRPRVRSTQRTCKPTPARNSTDACSNALSRRSAKPGGAITSRPARAPREPSTLPKYVAAPSSISCTGNRTLDRGQHSSVRNIGRHMLRATYGDISMPRRLAPGRATARDSNRRARSPARSLRPFGRPLAPRLLRHVSNHTDEVAGAIAFGYRGVNAALSQRQRTAEPDPGNRFLIDRCP